MRKEDKILLPPMLRLKLPKGFHVKRMPREYQLYASYPAVDAGHRPICMTTDLVGKFTGDSTADEIERYAQDAAGKLDKRLEHDHAWATSPRRAKE